jgi:TPP-dependent pyruvate/acetoin dehydrogenase alpha subunit
LLKCEQQIFDVCSSPAQLGLAWLVDYIYYDVFRYNGHSMSNQGSTYCRQDETSSVRQQRDAGEHVRKLMIDKTFMELSRE